MLELFPTFFWGMDISVAQNKKVNSTAVLPRYEYFTLLPWAAQVQNVWFETFSMFMLCANAVVIGVQTANKACA